MVEAAPTEQALLLHLLRGFVRARWLFVACLAAAAVAGRFLLEARFPFRQTLAVAALVFGYNLGFCLYQRRLRDRAFALRPSRSEAGLQIGLDLLALTGLVHFLGGAQSPLIVLYLIHAIAGGMLLPKRQSWLVAAGATALFFAVVVSEQQQLLTHLHPEGLLEPSPRERLHHQLALCLAFAVTMFTSVSITTWTMERLRLHKLRLIKLHAALLKKSEDLEKALATLADKQEQLLQTEKQAALGRLVSGIAHEINNPIQFITGNMAILSEAFLDVVPILTEHAASWPTLQIARLDYPFFRKQIPILLKDMADGAERISVIVRDLRTFARRDDGLLDEDVDLTEAVRASLRLLRNQLKHYQLREELAADLPRVRGNLTQLQQIVVNVVQNACQSMPANGTGTLRVCTRAEEGGRRIRLSIGDTGCGIPAEIRPHIFDPFFTTRPRTGGTGLGLAITDGIVKKHRGTIELESEVGVGTTFHFLLPTKESAS